MNTIIDANKTTAICMPLPLITKCKASIYENYILSKENSLLPFTWKEVKEFRIDSDVHLASKKTTYEIHHK